MFMLLGRSLMAIGLVATALVCAQPTMAAQPDQVAPSYDSLVARLDEILVGLDLEAESSLYVSDVEFG